MEVKQGICDEFKQIEVKQEVSDETCRAEIYAVDDGNLDIGKIEIKEEVKRESIHDTFDYVALEKSPIKTEIEQEEHKLTSCKERQTNLREFPQEKNTLEIIKTIDIQLSNLLAQEKTLKSEICGNLVKMEI
ncbi:uncharacterized protein LOC126881413 isoform X5 [Diabrotica virgifera virgifera]|uniref:Uncharacterized protein n=1 Tax=Diabrotica virgifera virgifera TaxID=50390 RepID=A0ABM5JUM5_DIAVI|nr:uncharacterized protein LOC126881413 isoform X5 [Diabrotica virgifera virgifera]